MIYSSLNSDSRERIFYSTYFDIKTEDCQSHMYDHTLADHDVVDIYVITFNNPFCVEYQIRTLRRFFKAPFNIVVIDNNNGRFPETSAEVLNICMRENVSYLRSPDNLYQDPDRFDPSMKLGTTMSWIYQNCVRRREPKYFGYLDHDCFLFKEFDIRGYLDEKGMYGVVSRSKVAPPAWNLHVTSNFYRYEFVKHLNLDFRAAHVLSLDTGGANYDMLYRHYKAEDYEIDQRGFKYTKDDIGSPDSFQYYVIQDDRWFHTTASSHDQLAGHGSFKIAYTKGFLDSKLDRIDNTF